MDTKKRERKGFASRIKVPTGTFKQWLRKHAQREEPLTPGQAERVKSLFNSLTTPPRPPKATPPARAMERRLTRPGSRYDDTQLAEAAAGLGISLAGLNEDQRRLLKTMSGQVMTNAARRLAIEDAAD